MQGLLFFHSLFRYVVLFLLLFSVLVAFKGLILRSPILIGERKFWIYSVIACHVQLALGVLMYGLRFQSYGHNAADTFWKYEHAIAMVLAVGLVTLGRVLSKKSKIEPRKQLYIAVFYLLGLIIMFASIPWPWSTIARKWI